MPAPTPDDERRAALAAMLDSGDGIALLEREEALAILDGFLRGRERDGIPFSEVEWIGIVQWAQYTRLDGGLLNLLREGAMGIDVDGPEVVFCAPPTADAFTAAEAFVAEGGDQDVRAGVLAFAAVRWAAGRLADRDGIERVARWVRTARANDDLMTAFVAGSDATIDYDARGRVAIYPPERL